MSSSITFDFIGWVCEGTHDKVYCAFRVGGGLYTGWGRRNKPLSFKAHVSTRDYKQIISKKSQKYREVDKFELFAMFPNFEDQVEERLLICSMSGKIR